MNRIILFLFLILAFRLTLAQQVEILLPTGHSEPLTSVLVSADDKWLVSGSYDKTVKIWDIKTGFLLMSFNDLNARIAHVDLSSDKKFLLATDKKGNSALWEIASQSLLHHFKSDFSCFKPNSHQILMLENNSIRLWDFQKDKNVGKSLDISKLGGEKKNAERIGFSSDGAMFYAISENILSIWDSKTLKQVMLFTAEKNIESAAFSPDGKNILVDIAQVPDKLIEIKSKHVIKEFTKKASTYSYDAEQMVITPDGRSYLFPILYSAYQVDMESGAIIKKFQDFENFLDWSSGREKKKNYRGHFGAVRSLCLSKDGKFLFTASADHTIIMWNLESGTYIKTFQAFSPKIENIALSNDGKKMAIAADQVVRIWDLESLDISQLFFGHKGDELDCIMAVKFLPGNQFLLSAGMDKSIKCWNLSDNSEQFTIKRAHVGFGVKSLAVVPDGKTFFSGAFSDEPVVKKWDFGTQQVLGEYNGSSFKAYESCISPEGKYLLSASSINSDWLSAPYRAGMIDIWNIADGKLINSLRKHQFEVFSVDISPDAKYMLSGSRDKTVKYWDFPSGRLIKTFSDHHSTVTQVRFYDEGNKFVSASRDKSIIFHDLKSNKATIVSNAHAGEISSIDFTPDRKYLFSASHDGSIKIWDLTKNQLLATLIEVSDLWRIGYYRSNRKFKSEFGNIVRKKNVPRIIILPDGYYMCSKEIAHYLAFKSKTEIFPFEQFDLKYNRPDIVLSRLGYADSSLIQAYHKAYLKRLKKMGFKEEDLGEDFHMPESKIKNFEYLPTITKEKEVEIDLNFNDTKYKLDRINIWINNVAVYGTKGIDLRTENTKAIDKKIKLELATGENKIQVSCLNQKGVESYKETVYITKEGKAPKSNLYIVSLGVSEYKNSQYNLTYASKDATDITKAFENSKDYDKVFTKTLTNAEVTKEKLQEIRAFLEQAGRDDVVMLFIAGHGVLDENLDYYLATFDMDFNKPSEKGIPYEELESVLDGIKPLKKILMMDACHSGEIDKDELQLAEATTTQQEQGAIKFRNVGAGVQRKETLGLQNTSEMMKELFTDLRKGTGATVISSAGGGEYAMESEQWKNGLFTYCLLNGLNSKAADLNNDGEIMLSELQQYVQSQVSKLSGGMQKPTSRIENIEMDFRVW